MPLILFTRTAQADADSPSRVVNAITFGTDETYGGLDEHGESIIYEISQAVQRHIAIGEVEGWDAIELEHRLLADCFKAVSAVEIGDPSGRFPFSHSVYDDFGGMSRIWIGPNS